MPQTDKPFASSPYEHAFGSLLLRAYPPGAEDARNAEFVAPGLQAQLARQSPLVGRLEAFGNFPAAGAATWSRMPGSGGRYQAGTAQGGVAFMPPDFGIENLLTGTQPPAGSPSPHFTFWGSKLGFGTPLRTGLTGTGFTVRLNTAAGAQDFVVDTTNAAGTASATQALRLDSVNSIGYVYGQPISTGPASPSQYAKSTIANVSSFSTVATVVAKSQPIPSNTFASGSIIRTTIHIICSSSHSDNVTFELRYGSTGTTSDTRFFGLVLASSGAGINQEARLVFETVLTGSGSTSNSNTSLTIMNGSSSGISGSVVVTETLSSIGTFDTTLSNGIVSCDLITAASTTSIIGVPPSLVEIVRF